MEENTFNRACDSSLVGNIQLLIIVDIMARHQLSNNNPNWNHVNPRIKTMQMVSTNKSNPIVILECYHVWFYSVFMRELMRNLTKHASYSEFGCTIDNMDFQIFSIYVNSIQSEELEEELYGKKEIMIEKEKL